MPRKSPRSSGISSTDIVKGETRTYQSATPPKTGKKITVYETDDIIASTIETPKRPLRRNRIEGNEGGVLDPENDPAETAYVDGVKQVRTKVGELSEKVKAVKYEEDSEGADELGKKEDQKPAKRTPAKKRTAKAGKNLEKTGDGEEVTSKKTPKKRKAKVESPDQDDREDDVVEAPEKKAAKRKAKAESEDDEQTVDGDVKKPKKKRKTKEEKEAEDMPLAARTAVQSLKRALYIGAHVSGAGGVHNSINHALHIGANAFALFLKSQRKWASPSLDPQARDQFKALSIEHSYKADAHVLPHGSYLVNLAQADAVKAEQAYTCFLDDLKRCEELGIKLYNFHPGNTGGNTRSEAIGRIASQLNKAHKATKTVITVLENMAGSGNVIGSTFEDLRDIITLINDKSRVGVCIDTCHSFAAGYDLRTPEAFNQTMKKFDETIGLKYLKALHLNDSKAPFFSHRDLHANIGTGFLGLRAFHNVVNFEGFQNLPMVLETPIDKKGEDGKMVEDKCVWAREIKLLEGLIGADVEGKEFKEQEERLQKEGEDERKKFQGQADRKIQKTLEDMLKKSSPKKRGGKKKVESEDEGCSH